MIHGCSRAGRRADVFTEMADPQAAMFTHMVPLGATVLFLDEARQTTSASETRLSVFWYVWLERCERVAGW